MITIPQDPQVFLQWSWEDFASFAADLLQEPLTAASQQAWMKGWTEFGGTVEEVYQRLYFAHTANTADEAVHQRYEAFLQEIYPKAMCVDQALKEKLLASGLVPEGFDIPLRNLRAEAALYREENLPLLSEEKQLSAEYDQIIGSQTVEWEGQELTPAQLNPVYLESDRARREKAWRLSFSRQLADREAINQLWQRNLALRVKLAANAGEDDYRAYRWKQLLRFDYTPADCQKFHEAIEKVVVPAANRIYERKRRRLGVETLRPWDLEVDPFKRAPLKPYTDFSQLIERCRKMFNKVDPELGGYFERMIREDLLDLENRKFKAPGAYSVFYPHTRVPIIFGNAVGIHDDVMTVLHEGGHAFHSFECAWLPYYQQLAVPMEFAEVASMGMELLASFFLAETDGGFYSAEDASRARVEIFEKEILFWPYMAVVDGFQHWVYTHAEQAADPSRCDEKWTELWRRFMPGVDWSGLDGEMMTGWQRKPHIHMDPFYYVEYGLALLGAVQLWRNSLQDYPAAVDAYRRALSRGGTLGLPDLFQTAGVKLAFDGETLASAVSLMEKTIQSLGG